MLNEKKEEPNFLSKIIDNSLNFLFSKNNEKWVFLFFILGFILRGLVALKAKFSADEMIAVPHSIGFIASGKLQPFQEQAVWFWLTDLFSKIFGVNALGVRFLAVLLGSLSIILVYLLGKEIFNEKIGLIASFIFAFSPFQLLLTLGEMDVPMSFFVFFSMYFLILFLKHEKNKFLIFSSLSLGIAIMIKSIALGFIPGFILFSLFYNKKHYKKYKFRQLIYAGLIILLMVLPVLTYNYLLIKDKGIADMQVARFTKIGFEIYESIAPTIQPFRLSRLLSAPAGEMPGYLNGLYFFYHNEVMLVILFSLIGLFFLFKMKNKFTWLLLISFIIPFIFLSGTSLMDKHFAFGTYFISLFSAIGTVKISEKFKTEKAKKFLICLILLLIFIFCIIKIQNSYYIQGFFGKNELAQMIDFKDKYLEKNAFLIVDSRIYRGRIAFMFWDRHYLESSYFPQFMDEQNSYQGNYYYAPTYFIEAVTDDSGWGTIKNQPEFNQSMEDITDFFKQNSQLIKTIKGIDGNAHFNIYQTTLPLRTSFAEFAESTHFWFFYPVGYKPLIQNFDYYETYSVLDSLLDKIAHLVLYLEILFSFVFMLYLFLIFFKKTDF